MTHADVVIYQYNFWVQRFQFDINAMRENQTPPTTFLFASDKLRDEVAKHLHSLAEFAYAGGEGDLAHQINCAAFELHSDGVPPMPM
ncbi:hypothetical protein [Vibrio vulnificus]|uniref:hypothetical protein n=1 Tax=Vibrio vulnificus TaxID=672 RepID=UPI00102A8CFC|nr:hypothetical protein [Vibrio vulnificus]RZP89606.1 hypothetical protein D8T54_19700 [Vibrio vulnificus]RZR41908.1 hypothetical protein D8T58_20185 [Vibrio vulnificus]